jgi:hypothetical protein
MRFCILYILFLPSFLHAQYKFYFGNIHAHSSYSDGCHECGDNDIKTPADCFQFAKHSKHLDFLGISEHNHNVQGVGMHLENYQKGLDQADAENDDGNFVCMYGLEFGLNSGGHVIVYGLKKLPGWEDDNFDTFCDKDDYTKLWGLVNEAKAFATLAHPEGSHFNNLRNLNFKPTADKVVCGIAVASGPFDSEAEDYSDRLDMEYKGYFQTMLALGYHVGPTIDHDNHFINFGRGAASRTVVLARKLDRDSIIAAYKAMRFYASQDWNAQVTMTIKDRPMGSELNSKIDPVIRVKIKDADAEKVDYIKVMYGRAGSKIKPKALASVLKEDFIVATHSGAHVGEVFYYYAEIVQKDGDVIVTAPIWVKRI